MQVAQRHGYRFAVQHGRGLGQFRRCLKFSLRGNDLGSASTFRFRLGRDGALHLLRQVDLLDLDLRHFDTPHLGLFVEDRLKSSIQLGALREKVVQLHFAKHRAEAGLRGLLHGVPKVLDRDDCLVGVGDQKVDDRIHFERDVVARDDILCWDVPGDDAKRDLYELVDRPEDEHKPRTLFVLHRLAQPKDDAAFVLPQDVDAPR